jgi:hypothetical protein
MFREVWVQSIQVGHGEYGGALVLLEPLDDTSTASSAAKELDVVLLLDEGDALFARRTEVGMLLRLAGVLVHDKSEVHWYSPSLACLARTSPARVLLIPDVPTKIATSPFESLIRQLIQRPNWKDGLDRFGGTCAAVARCRRGVFIRHVTGRPPARRPQGRQVLATPCR